MAPPPPHARYVDEVIIGAPGAITDDLLKTFNIGLVVRGSTSETSMLGPVEEVRGSGRVWGRGVREGRGAEEGWAAGKGEGEGSAVCAQRRGLRRAAGQPAGHAGWGWAPRVGWGCAAGVGRGSEGEGARGVARL